MNPKQQDMKIFDFFESLQEREQSYTVPQTVKTTK
jgi:hypothetical protein